jgi:peptide/nickel transport system substrate-binding protein
MLSRAQKFRMRRLLRLRKLQVEELGTQAEEGLERNFFKRLDRLVRVRRFVINWVLLLVLLAGITIAQTKELATYYQSLEPAPGGTYSEGIVGAFGNANPIYAQDPVDITVSHLIFASLFTYNGQNKLVGDLAQSISSNNLGTVWTVKLKPNLTWQDGQPLTAADVVFTYHTIQSPDAESPLYNSWQNVTVSERNTTTVTFTLANPLASFPYSLTNGIIPQHILGQTPMADMRSSNFNSQDPIGAGPFTWNGVEVTSNPTGAQEEQISLRPFDRYYGGKPKLDSFEVQTFANQASMVTAFQKRDITAMDGLIDMPSKVQVSSDVWAYDFPETAAVMTFFKTSTGVLSDKSVRQALVQASNTPAILSKLSFPAEPVDEPLLRNQLAYNLSFAQSSYNPRAAAATLTSDGWIPGKNGIRYKGGQQLAFGLYTENDNDYDMAARSLIANWRAVGANVQLISQNDATFQTTLAYHSYDALLTAISIGVDPDVFVYWDSSQADVRSPERLNFSEYSDPTADESLEEGRTRLDPALRVIKYEDFLQQWQQDAPALGLYQPRYLYVTRGEVYGLDEHTINSPTDRFDNVQNWEILENRVTH